MNEAEFGVRLTPNGAAFRLWAPAAKRVDVVLDHSVAMQRDEDGWFFAEVRGARAGTLYKYRIDDSTDVSDPASYFQPSDIAGPSEILDHGAYKWRATGWHGRPWNEAVIMEAHVGTFTKEGTYRAMIGKLDHLAETGFTALELMPLADFPGRRNWGYDGVLWYAPDSSYGHPDDLKALIDEAHLRGLMVLLDAVYNHFGPEGNYLGRYAPQFFSGTQTPWGGAIDYRVPQVRQFAIGSAIHWLREYRFDGLRLDAVHEIVENGNIPLLHDLSIAAGELAKSTGREIHLVLENDDNRASILDPNTDPAAGKYRAQWNDDYHHAWHVLLTGENGSYYRDYPRPRESIARALGSGFIYQGETSVHRGGRPRGEPSKNLPPTAFINFLQNHDQIGNRAMGDRLAASVDPAAIEAALAITLLAPMPPMMFMGEEWGSTTPFPFFCDFTGELADAVRQGRRREFETAHNAFGGDVPDPLDASTFELAKLDWTESTSTRGRERLALVRHLLSIRRTDIVPVLAQAAFDHAGVQSNGYLTATWKLGDGTLLLQANLSSKAIASHSPATANNRLIFGEAGDDLKPWGVVWAVEAAPPASSSNRQNKKEI
ncbi:MAG: malto-oligosyltrehalose trehalohydrolase [Xanthobacteraceae bacterium]|nr:malto-oligosyltrehalose trehalohydrolase [Xanthobacteraceae bacterium]